MKRWGPHRAPIPPPGALLAIEAAARLGSFRAAAEELHVTQGAVAQQVRAAEADLGHPLFDRQPRGLQVTEAARPLIEQIAQSLSALSGATEAFRQRLDPGVSHRVILSAPPSISARWLIPRLGRFHDAGGDIAIAIDASTALRPLTGPDRVDLAIRWGVEPPGLWSKLLLPGPFVVVGAPGLAEPVPRAPRDLVGLPLISDGYDVWGDWFQQMVGEVPEFSGPDLSLSTLAIEAAERGLGLALAPEPLVRGALAEGRLERVFAEDCDLHTERGFYLVAAEPALRPPARRVAEWLLAESARAEAGED
ncbi:MAG: LysR substrate-binding domain-containing protein [Pseudomonadota bacterium]